MPIMDFVLSQEQQTNAKQTAEFAAREITPHLDRLENDLPYRMAFYKRMAQAGLLLLTVPKESQGQFTDTLSYLIALKTIAKADAGISVAMAVTNMVAETICQYGNDEQRTHYLKRVATGESVPLAFALTEKNSGSDAKSIQTEALYQDDSVIITGEKQFISNGDIAGTIIVLAKTNPNAGADGISAFLIDHGTPGLKAIKTERKLGLLTANLVTLRLDHCRIPRNQQLGDTGQGFKIALHALDSGRLGIAAQSIGIAEAAYEAALKFSKSRHQFGRAICENQAIAFKLADMHLKLSAARALLAHAAWCKDQGLPFTIEAAEAKLFCSEMCNEIASEALNPRRLRLHKRLSCGEILSRCTRDNPLRGHK